MAVTIKRVGGSLVAVAVAGLLALPHWFAVRGMLAGSSGWDTPHLILLNVVTTPIIVGVVMTVIAALWPRGAGRVSGTMVSVTLALAAALVVGVPSGEIVLNNRTRDTLAARLSDPSVEVRRAAVKELARSGYAGAIPQLTTALGDSDPEVRVFAVQALGQTESRAAAGPLAAVLRGGDAELHRFAVAAVENLWDKRSERSFAPALAALIDRGGPSRQAAARVIAKMHDPDGAAALDRAAARADTVVVRGAYRYYIEQGSAGSEPLLVQALTESGNKEMAEDFLNCGNEALKSAALSWAAARGFEVKPSGSAGTVRWGR